LTVLLVASGLPMLVGGLTLALGGNDNNAGLSAVAAPIGLGFLYGGWYNLRLSHPRIPWLGTPGFAQSCLLTSVGFFVLATVLSVLGALLDAARSMRHSSRRSGCYL
jgi:hypothetical protein